MLTVGEKPKVLYDYLCKNGYSDILDNACKATEHLNTPFMKIWEMNPHLCLSMYYIRKTAGRKLREI